MAAALAPGCSSVLGVTAASCAGSHEVSASRRVQAIGPSGEAEEHLGSMRYEMDAAPRAVPRGAARWWTGGGPGGRKGGGFAADSMAWFHGTTVTAEVDTGLSPWHHAGD
eukprot:CAMPEP_0115859254 /NCGR_PEP_ID=MMETSP0287-20121206/16521_1 /TAXON_ID=412157 /ORGANISM="Chrysochromulina rotalis, Strain UIO044" /LENGTH=109 /DNA_ID=CAMNT_0003313549 /DNA_START=142 /DNA_END=472 /DNA_ORIENTATION=+